MYERITDENPYKVPMRIYPAVHYTMGGLWVDYDLMSNVPGLFVLGEANFSDHGANRLGASALMQGLADGYFVIRYTMANYLAGLLGTAPVPTDDPAFAQAETAVGDTVARAAVDQRHPLGRPLPPRARARSCGSNCGMARNQAGLEKALAEIPALREEFWKDVRVLGAAASLNQSLEKADPGRRLLRAGRADGARRPAPRGVAAAATSGWSSQTEEGEALRDDDHFAYVGAWEWTGKGSEPDAPQGTARVRVRQADPEVVQVSTDGTRQHATMDITLKVWRQAPGRRGQDGHLRRRVPRASAPTCRSSRCSTSSTSG